MHIYTQDVSRSLSLSLSVYTSLSLYIYIYIYIHVCLSVYLSHCFEWLQLVVTAFTRSRCWRTAHARHALWFLDLR